MLEPPPRVRNVVPLPHIPQIDGDAVTAPVAVDAISDSVVPELHLV